MPKLLFIVASEKGGVGKTCLSLALYDKLTLDGHSPAVIQIDRQRRLSDAIGGAVLTIASDPQAQRIDPASELSRFSPVLDKIENVAGHAPIIIDVGAGEAGRFCNWAGLVDLEEEIDGWGLTCISLIPFLSEGESIRQAAWTAGRLRAVLPSSNIIFFENQRDGLLSKLLPTSDAAVSFVEYLQPCLASSKLLTMQMIPAGSWRYFESANCRFIDVVGMPTEQVMQVTGLSKAEAKISRGDVSQWLINLFDQLDLAFKADH